MPPVLFIAKNKPIDGQENVSKKVWKMRVPPQPKMGVYNTMGFHYPLCFYDFVHKLN